MLFSATREIIKLMDNDDFPVIFKFGKEYNKYDFNVDVKNNPFFAKKIILKHMLEHWPSYNYDIKSIRNLFGNYRDRNFTEFLVAEDYLFIYPRSLSPETLQKLM